MNDVVIAGAGPNGLMLAGELGLAGMRPVVLEPLAGPNPQRRANGITGQAVRLLDHRGLYSVLAGTPDPPQPSPWAMFAAMALDLTGGAGPRTPHRFRPPPAPGVGGRGGGGAGRRGRRRGGGPPRGGGLAQACRR